jgi:hypothetical protein
MTRTWETLSLLEQVVENLRSLSGLHRMQVSHDWPHWRTLAALDAERRIRRYEVERAGRLEVYARGGAVESYRRRWRSLRDVRSHVIRLDVDERFTRGMGGAR